MRFWQPMWVELREILWLASIVWGLSLLGVGVAVILAFALDGWPDGIAAMVKHV